ncbi:putative membrane protein [Mycetocola reblochoni REB411]|uniref:Putative membrane protein n=1 Tax=Mycetocola reblochoni REB411 TaxID=1255698 RepID=A0A1R4K988_9MICO|nr:putative membrane protein [Mycetocola reblochoni REB411]
MGAGVLAVLLLVYLVVAGQRAVMLIATGEPVAVAMGVALLVLPLVGVWALVREWRFGVQAERLGVRLEREGALPEEELPVRASGRVDRDAADGVFPRYRAAVDAPGADWRDWFRLALVYDAAGDRRRARAAVRRAIAEERSG